VLIALPAFLARTVTVVCLGAGVALMLLVFRLAEHAERKAARSAPLETLDADHGAITTGEKVA
jgi:hypothetical protein